MDLQKLANLIRSRVRKDWDIVIAVAGEEGVGKSTFAIQLAKLIDPNFTIKDNVIFNPKNKEVTEKVKNLPKYSCLVLDEAIKTMYKLNWASTEQKLLNMAFALGRKYNQVVLLCIPRFRDLNEQFRNHRAKLWIQLADRGLAAVFTPDRVNIFGYDPWHMDENYRMIKKYMKKSKYAEINTDRIVGYWNNVGNFLDVVRYDKLNGGMFDEYVRLKGEVNIAEIEDMTKSDQYDQLKQVNDILRDVKGMTTKERAEILPRKIRTLQKWDKAVSDGIRDTNS